MPHDFGRSATLDRKVVYEGSIGEFGVEEVELPGGRRASLAVLHHPGASAVVPLTDAGEVVLLRQYRHAVSATLWEIPAGKLDPGESPETCARRELLEETGYTADALVPLGPILTTPGFTDEVIHLFVATGLRAGRARPDPTETLETSLVPFERALELIDSGELRDAKSVAGLLLAARKHPR
jgi:ADP-ribose pyrophosphatase